MTVQADLISYSRLNNRLLVRSIILFERMNECNKAELLVLVFWIIKMVIPGPVFTQKGEQIRLSCHRNIKNKKIFRLRVLRLENHTRKTLKWNYWKEILLKEDQNGSTTISTTTAASTGSRATGGSAGDPRAVCFRRQEMHVELVESATRKDWKDIERQYSFC